MHIINISPNIFSIENHQTVVWKQLSLSTLMYDIDENTYNGKKKLSKSPEVKLCERLQILIESRNPPAHI